MPRYVTVIKMDCGIIQNVYVYTQHAPHDAETKFRRIVESIDEDVTDEQMTEYLEDGYRDPIGGETVDIIWSEN